MSIQELSLKFKRILNNVEYQLAGLIIAVAVVSFFLGRDSLNINTQVSEVDTQNVASVNISTESDENTLKPAESGKYVASKNGTKYHLPWCSGAKQMSEKNKIWFETKEDAEKAGYEPAANCKGI